MDTDPLKNLAAYVDVSKHLQENPDDEDAQAAQSGATEVVREDTAAITGQSTPKQ